MTIFFDMESVLLSQSAWPHLGASASNSQCNLSNSPLSIDHDGTSKNPQGPDESYLGVHPALRDGRQGSPSRRATSIISVIDPIAAPNAPNRPVLPTMLQPLVTRHRRLGSDPVSLPREDIRPRQHRSYEGVWVPRSRRKYACFNYRARSCTSILKDRDARKKLVAMIISALFLAAILAVYLALAVSKTTMERELRILLIFMIMMLAVVFCHFFIRFCITIFQGPKSVSSRNRVPSKVGPAGYAQPESPIPVIVTGDEEILVGGNGAIREKPVAPPPAYGLWRSSVRINPDLLYWRRVSGTPLAKDVITEECEHRPPSYVSDNGVDYVIDAHPRSVAPANSHSGT